jgi:hypothetical protein
MTMTMVPNSFLSTRKENGVFQLTENIKALEKTLSTEEHEKVRKLKMPYWKNRKLRNLDFL